MGPMGPIGLSSLMGCYLGLRAPWALGALGAAGGAQKLDHHRLCDVLPMGGETRSEVRGPK
eukprot:8704826-Pyramimonas_sp.AAC.1